MVFSFVSEYSKFLTMPKLMVSGASDEFFMCDDYDYFYEDLLEPKFIWCSISEFQNLFLKCQGCV